jgi:hypothetical protein
MDKGTVRDPLGVFEDAVFEAFGSLISDFKLQLVRSMIHVPEIAVFFERGSVGLSVKFELGLTPWVELAHIVRSESGLILERKRCSLNAIVAERAVDEPRLTVRLDDVGDRRLRGILTELARRVRRYASDVLQGNVSIVSSVSDSLIKDGSDPHA